MGPGRVLGLGEDSEVGQFPSPQGGVTQQRKARAGVRRLPPREVPWAQESVEFVTGAEEEEGHRARGRKRSWMMGLKNGH